MLNPLSPVFVPSSLVWAEPTVGLGLALAGLGSAVVLIVLAMRPRWPHNRPRRAAVIPLTRPRALPRAA